MKNRKQLDGYLDNLEARLDIYQADNLFQQLPAMIEHIIALAGPVSGPPGSGKPTPQPVSVSTL